MKETKKEIEAMFLRMKKERDCWKGYCNDQKKIINNGRINYNGLANDLVRIKNKVLETANIINKNNEFLLCTDLTRDEMSGVIKINEKHLDQIERVVISYSIPNFEEEECPF